MDHALIFAQAFSLFIQAPSGAKPIEASLIPLYCSEVAWSASKHSSKTLNTFDPHLQFTMEVGGRSLYFLDLLIYIENNRIETSVYNSKPTAFVP